MQPQVEVLLPNALDHGFDYLAPEGMTLAAGDIVSVPFGRGESLGVVWGEGKAALAKGRIKPVTRRHAQFPPVSKAMRDFIDWAAWYNCAPKGSILKMVLPVSDIDKEGRTKLNTDIDPAAIRLAGLSPGQATAASALEARLDQGFSVTLLDGVTGSGKTEVYFDAVAHLLRIQDSGFRIQEEKNRPSLNPESRILNPVPQTLVLLPEIALSVQWLERFERRFGFTPVLWNSEVTPARKRAAWQAIATGEARVVVGARSALFLPYRNLRLLVADEEHDGSYKQEEGVIYHARDMAVARARFEKLPVVLVSATPSLESYHNARQGKYHEVSLPARHNAAVLPKIELLDMRNTPMERGAFIATPLREKLAQAVANNHQALLFLNRRGYAPLVLCRACGHRFQCPNCTGWMVMHKGRIQDSGFRIQEERKNASLNPESRIPIPILQCHHCSFHAPLPHACPACAAEDKFAACGPGVERIYEEVRAFLPEARVAVMASDSMTGSREMEGTISAMSDKAIDILIGTQMIAKGHHFADVSVVGVVDADLGLSGGDLRASERTYQLLHQLSGRAGREKIPGTVYMQSFLPEHPVMKALLSGERDAFLAAELQARRNAHMPPFSRLAAVIVEGLHEEQVQTTARRLARSAHPAPSIHILGPAPAPLYRLRNKFRQRLLVQAERNVNLPDFMKQWVEGQKHPSSVRIKVDIDPMSFL